MFIQLLILKTLRHLLIQQEKIMAQIDDLNTKITALEADEANIAADLAELITELKASAAPIPQSVFDRLDALHAKLQGDDATAKAAETPAPPVTPTT